MGDKVDHYVDDYGDVVKDGDTVIWKGKSYTVIYISHHYVNLTGNGGLHLPFKLGKPYLLREFTAGPIKEKVVRTIIPGTYGNLSVNSKGGVHVGWTHDPDTIRRIAKTLLDIADIKEEEE